MQIDFDETYRTAIKFLENPHILWGSGTASDRKLVLRLTFDEKLAYHRNGGFRTAKTTLPFKVLEAINDNKYDLVDPIIKTLNRFIEILHDWEIVLGED